MPRVTDILSILKYDAPVVAMADAVEQGQLVHRYALSKLAGIYLPPPPTVIQPYLDRVSEWVDVMVQDVIAVEKELTDRVLTITGHVDLIVKLKGYREAWVIDLKRVASLQYATTALQLSAYWYLSSIKYRRKFLRGALHIPTSGNVKLWVPRGKPTDDWAIFLNLYNVYKFKEKMGRKNEQ